MSLADSLFLAVRDVAGGAWDSKVAATLTRPHTLKSGGRTAVLEVAVAVAGAATVTLRAVRAEPSTVVALSGGVPAGISLTIGAVDYAVTSAAVAAGNALVVGISPVLAAPASVAAPVTLAAAVTFDLGLCLRQGVSSRLPPDLAAVTSFELHVPAAKEEPLQGDLITAGGTPGIVLRAEFAGGGWAVQVGPG